MSKQAESENGVITHVVAYHMQTIFEIDHSAVTPEHAKHCRLNVSAIIEDISPSYNAKDFQFEAVDGQLVLKADFDSSLIYEIEAGHIQVKMVSERIPYNRNEFEDQLDPEEAAFAKMLGDWAARREHYRHAYKCQYPLGSEFCMHPGVPRYISPQQFKTFLEHWQNTPFAPPLTAEEAEELYRVIKTHDRFLGICFSYHPEVTEFRKLNPDRLLACLLEELDIKRAKAFIIAYQAYLDGLETPREQSPATHLVREILSSGR